MLFSDKPESKSKAKALWIFFKSADFHSESFHLFWSFPFLRIHLLSSSKQLVDKLIKSEL